MRRRKITVMGDVALDGVVHADVVSHARLPGSDVVVLGRGLDHHAAGRDVARHAPAAVVVAVGEEDELPREVTALIGALLLPRARVLGVTAADLPRALDAVLFGTEASLRAAVLCRGECGVHEEVAVVPVRVGAGGVRSIGPA
jgi:hypothetical protein